MMKRILLLNGPGVLISVVLLYFCTGCTSTSQEPVAYRFLAPNGEPRPLIVHGADTDSLQASVRDLADYLERITGVAFPVEMSDGQPRDGIWITLQQDVPAFFEAMPDKLKGEQSYYLKSGPERLWLIGANAEAVDYAVWDLLGRLGYRQYFPGDTWEIVPQLDNPVIAIDAKVSPSYYTRRITFTWGVWDYNREPFAQWNRRNRMGGTDIRPHHIYETIYNSRRELFAKHPEYLALVDGQRDVTRYADLKFCISNPGLRNVVEEWALEQFERDPTLSRLSMEPSDSGRWCECEPCAELGSISDRVVLLANQVIRAVRSKFGDDKSVAYLAYNQHATPPNIPVEPGTIVCVATAFNPTGQRYEELIEGWADQGALLGIYDYFSYYPWDHDLPARAKASAPQVVAELIQRAHTLGSRYYSAEASDNWGPNGLGYYIAAQTMWDVSVADQVEEIIDEFIAHCFPGVETPMREVYNLLVRAPDRQHTRLSPHMLGRLYTMLDQAYTHAADAPVRERVAALIVYTHFIELQLAYQNAAKEDRAAAFEEVVRWAYRMRTTMMVHTRGIYRHADYGVESSYLSDDTRWDVPEGENPWKSSAPFEDAELRELLTKGRAIYPSDPITYRSFSGPLTQLKHEDGADGIIRRMAAKSRFVLLADNGQLPEMRILTGRGRPGTAPGTWILRNSEETQVAQGSVPSDNDHHALVFPTNLPDGTYYLDYDDNFMSFQPVWDSGAPISVWADGENWIFNSEGGSVLWAYVPKETTTAIFYGRAQRVRIFDASNRLIYDEGEDNSRPVPRYMIVPVPEGSAGQPWKIHFWARHFHPVNLPPLLSPYPQSLLVPQEVLP